MRSFPTSYPYSNRVGLTIDKDELEALSELFLNSSKPKTLDLGLELSYIILWGLSKATDVDHLMKLVGGLFYRTIKRSPKKQDSTDELLHRIIDPISLDKEDRILETLDMRKALGGSEAVEQLTTSRSRDRLKKLYQLKKLWEG